ncbi:MAG: D-tyrosyl-tRNA(Tyr) deacylase [Muribaculaceae bacterium]|nr:D-tyrosyl-tRNA(Tyr) deacylase [Muribaculaceae bacterium]MDE6346868.1 D-tyrosyl-tRNA(Tyr) deacylase [Muribaculaceae bacterium]
MRIVIQRAKRASVSVKPDYVREIDRGLMILVGVEKGDTAEDAGYLARKTAMLRIFDDEAGVMNRSVVDIDGEILAVSQFTLLASTRKGNRPSYLRSAGGDEARQLYDTYCDMLAEAAGREVKRGIFGADMAVELINDGPVTIIIDSRLCE